MAPKFSVFPFRDRESKKVTKESISGPMPLAAPAGQLGRQPLADLSTNKPLLEFPRSITSPTSTHLRRSVSDVDTSRETTSAVKAQTDVPALLPSTVYSPPSGLTKTAGISPLGPAFLDSLFANPMPKPSSALPCSGGLTHRLAGCCHLVRTDRPEPCAQNCHGPNQGEASIAEIMDHFVCLQCIEAEIVERDRKRRESLEKEQEQTEAALGYPLVIRQREFRLESQLLQEEQKDVDDFVDAGRPSFPVFEQALIPPPGLDEDVDDKGLPAHENDTIDDAQKPPERNAEERPTSDFVESYYGEHDVAIATLVPILTGAEEVYIRPKSAWSSSSEDNATAGDSGSNNAGTEKASENMTALPRGASSTESATAGDFASNNAAIETSSEDITALPPRTSGADSAAASDSRSSSVGDDAASDVTALPSSSKPKKLHKERNGVARFWKKAKEDIHKWF